MATGARHFCHVRVLALPLLQQRAAAPLALTSTTVSQRARLCRSVRGCTSGDKRSFAAATGGASAPWVRHAGEGALLIRFGTEIDIEVNKRALACLSALEQVPPTKRPVGLQSFELIPAYASVLVRFDPLLAQLSEVERWCMEASAARPDAAVEASREVTIPVRYGGADGPDLESVVRITGLSSAEEVVRIHASGVYRVFFLGFLGGFPYMGGLPAALASVQRLPTPRQRIPKGSVAIAAGQAGVYTVSAPAGWYLLGKTPMNLFDPEHDPPAVLKAGDTVKFVPAPDCSEQDASTQNTSAPYVPANPWIEVISAGPLTTVQDLGRYGYARHGVSRAGAADDLALRMGNALLGNDDNAAGLEVTMGGLKIRCAEPTAIALTGADCKATLQRPGCDAPKKLKVNEVIELKQNDVVELGYAKSGSRAYVCVHGGVDVKMVLGSRSTDVRAGLGGFEGRALQPGDRVGRLEASASIQSMVTVSDPLRERPKTWQLRLLPGPGNPSSDGPGHELVNELPALVRSEFKVSARSDRMAVVISPAEDAHGTSTNNNLVGGQQMSEACVSGTIQLPPDGNPVILLAEHQTTGGYKVPAVVIQADLWQVGQMRAGDSVRFVQTTRADAIAALSDRRIQARKIRPKTAADDIEKLSIADGSPRTITDILQDQVASVMVNGYRPGEGIDADRYPTSKVVKSIVEIEESLAAEAIRETAYTRFARGEGTYEEYIESLRSQLDQQGGAWMTVAPRDTAQQGNDSESASITHLSRLCAEVWAEKGGCVGYEIGGAQYQAGLIRGFDPSVILTLGLPCNMPAHSLQRAQYVNGLAELPAAIRRPLFASTAQLVSKHYRHNAIESAWIPWQPYNFHAGNFYDGDSHYSPQDETTSELLAEKCIPMPTWVFSAKFTLDALEAWTNRQIDIFAAAGLSLHQVRIKNPGHGNDWNASSVWTHVQVIKSVFHHRGMVPPIVYIHNHDFNGRGGHVCAELLRKAQAEGFSNLVIDAAYRKNGTHNDNTVVVSGLNLTAEQHEALHEYNHIQQQIEQVLCRFDSRASQMTPWDSDWAGGTEGSDIQIAKEFGLNPRHINHAKEVANEVFPLERAVTPFSEYKLRLGIAIMIENGIQPKSADAVRAWIANGGKLKVGGDVLVGLKRWETLVPKSSETDQLLSNMQDELKAALGASSKLVVPEEIPSSFSANQVHNVLGYQSKGVDFVTKRQGTCDDLTPLLVAPHVLHSRPLSLKKGTSFEILTDPEDTSARAKVEFRGFGRSVDGDILMKFIVNGKALTVEKADPAAVAPAPAEGSRRKATPGNTYELACSVPGELLSYSVSPGDLLAAGSPLCVVESMKMEMKISVPDELDGLEVKHLPCRGRTKDSQGDLLKPGDLLLEVQEPTQK